MQDDDNQTGTSGRGGGTEGGTGTTESGGTGEGGTQGTGNSNNDDDGIGNMFLPDPVRMMAELARENTRRRTQEQQERTVVIRE